MTVLASPGSGTCVPGAEGCVPVAHDGPPGIEVWVADLDDVAARVADVPVSAAEMQRALRFRFEHDRSRFLARRRLMRRLLSRASGRPVAGLVLEADALGQLHCPGLDGWTFSHGHSGPWGLFALGRDVGIGVDIEQTLETGPAPAVPDDALSRRERQAWEAVTDGPARQRLRLTAWVRKEACLKALGIGLAVPPAEVDVGGLSQAVETCVPVNGQACSVRLFALSSPQEWVGALAVADIEQTRKARVHAEGGR